MYFLIVRSYPLNVFSRTLAERIFNHFSQYSATVGLFFRNISYGLTTFHLFNSMG